MTAIGVFLASICCSGVNFGLAIRVLKLRAGDEMSCNFAGKLFSI